MRRGLARSHWLFQVIISHEEGTPPSQRNALALTQIAHVISAQHGRVYFRGCDAEADPDSGRIVMVPRFRHGLRNCSVSSARVRRVVDCFQLLHPLEQALQFAALLVGQLFVLQDGDDSLDQFVQKIVRD